MQRHWPSKDRKASEILDQRKSGRRLIFSTIRAQEEVARIDIAEITGISAATVTSVTAELIAAGLIEEVDRNPEEEMRRGRPRVMLRLRPEAHVVAGMKFSNSRVNVAILDFIGNPIADYEARLPEARLSTDQFAAFTAKTLQEATHSCGMTVEHLSGIGIGLAGIVDAPRGFVHWSPQLKDRNVPLLEALQSAIDVPLFIDNDANLVAMAEQWFGYGKGVSDFIVVTIEHGVGMGIVIDNQIYRGTRGCGAEFGHMKVQLDGALCRCGQRGCLEAYLADYAILREAEIATQTGDDETSEEKLVALFREARSGNETASLIFQRAGRMFAMGLANLVNIFDPKLIIISGERMQFEYLFEDEVIEAMRKSIVQIDSNPPEVRIHTWGDLMWARGAAAYATEGVTEIALDGISG